MKPTQYVAIATALAMFLLGGPLQAQASAHPPVTVPPDSFFKKVREKDRDAARAF